MLAVGGLPVFNVVVVKFYINCMVAINRCMIVLVLILIYTSLTVNYSYLRIIRLTRWNFYSYEVLLLPTATATSGLTIQWFILKCKVVNLMATLFLQQYDTFIVLPALYS